MIGFIPKLLAAAGFGLLCFGVVFAYDFVGFSGSTGPSATVLWSVVGGGFVLAGIGSMMAAFQIPRDRRKKLAFALFVFGIAVVVPAVLITHVGPLLLLLAVPALLLSAIVGATAIPFSRLWS